MHKRKDGKVVASLTEVKNKTGDIFSLVDEFGEVWLTSYNKFKYKIVKIDISSTIQLDEVDSKPEEKKKSVLQRVRESLIKPESTEIIVEEEEDRMLPQSILDELKNLKIWDRNSKDEIKFTVSIKKPLQ
ncbi:MAG: hypothetical protein Kow0081_0480 [Candidatus Dojkabacteria bacterium]